MSRYLINIFTTFVVPRGEHDQDMDEKECALTKDLKFVQPFYQYDAYMIRSTIVHLLTFGHVDLVLLDSQMLPRFGL